MESLNHARVEEVFSLVSTMQSKACQANCGDLAHFNRRTLLQAAGCAGLSWITPLSEALARGADAARGGQPPRSMIVLWMNGGPSQLETLDPHPGLAIGGETQAIATAAKGVRIGSGLEQVADVMDSISIVRSVTSKEGDHERATYNVKTGFRPDPTLIHPSIGAVLCHQLTDDVEIPRHVAIQPGQWPARGGYLGDQYDAFNIGDPVEPVPDVRRRVAKKRFNRRVNDLFNVVEPEFARGRLLGLDSRKTLHGVATRAALSMMSSEQLKAFDIQDVPRAERLAYGDTPFGRGCLVARRLIEVGVRCVEVTLNGWDSHFNNHELQSSAIATLDPAFATLIKDLRQRDLLDSTIVLWGGEFGRTPRINPAGGRDHWPHGFSIALAGGGIRGGMVYGGTSPTPDVDAKDHTPDIQQPRNVADVHATVLHALGIDFAVELDTPIGRPMIISEGSPIKELLT